MASWNQYNPEQMAMNMMCIPSVTNNNQWPMANPMLLGMMPEQNTPAPTNPSALPPLPAPVPMEPGNFIGPVLPGSPHVQENAETTSEEPEVSSTLVNEEESSKDKNGDSLRDRRDNRERSHNRRRSRDRGDRRHSRDRYDRKNRRDRNDRNDREERYKSGRDYRDRNSKWDNNKAAPSTVTMGLNNMMGVVGGTMPFGMNNMIMGQQPTEMSNLPNMLTSSMNLMPNMMISMMDQNMIMNQQLMMPTQMIHVQNGIFLPALPNTEIRKRREKPPGCRTVFVAGLPNTITEELLRETFGRYGDITDIKIHKQGYCHVRFETEESVELCFHISGMRFKFYGQADTEASAIFIDYALNRDDQIEFDRTKRAKRGATPPRPEPLTSVSLTTIGDKVKSDDGFLDGALTLAAWLERGECNKKNANIFYSLVQASNNQVRRLYNEKIQLDEEYHNMKTNMKEKFARLVAQFEQVAKVLTAAKHQRVSDHFSKQQRRNVEIWLKMTEDVVNIKEEFSSNFDDEDEDVRKQCKSMVAEEKYEELKMENENLINELEGYKNEVYLSRDEAERKFEKFKAHFIAQQALQNKQTVYPPLPPPLEPNSSQESKKPPPPPEPPTTVTQSQAKLISLLTAYLLIHPMGATLENLMGYVKPIVPSVTLSSIAETLYTYADVFSCKTIGFGAHREQRWTFVTFNV